MIEERIEDAQQHVARFWDSGSMQNRKDPKVRHGRQNSQLSDILGSMPKKSSQGTSGSHNRSSSSTQDTEQANIEIDAMRVELAAEGCQDDANQLQTGSQPGLRNPRLRETACAAHGIRQRSVPETHGCVRTSSRDSLATGGAVLRESSQQELANVTSVYVR